MGVCILLPGNLIPKPIVTSLSANSDLLPEYFVPIAGYATKTAVSDRKSVVQGKSVDLGGRRIIKKKKNNKRKTKNRRFD